MDDDSIFSIIDTIRILDQSAKTVDDDDRKRRQNGCCKHCGAGVERLWLQDGNITCRVCHTVTDRFLDESAEWLSPMLNAEKGSAAKDMTRCGLPVNELLPQISYGSHMGYAPAMSHELTMVRKYQFWNSLSYRDRVMLKMFESISVYSSTECLPKSILEQAKTFYKKLSDAICARGVNRTGAMAACVYMACKKEGVPRSVKEIATIFSVSPTVVIKGCGTFDDALGDQFDLAPSSAIDFVTRFSQALRLDRNRVAQVELVIAEHEDALGFAPTSLAAGAIYHCSEKGRWGLSKKTVADACSVTTVTVGKCSGKLRELSKDVDV
jgi:transcription initiation factor TFIIB